ncbi:TetR/AcrR family transcriptional regulator [Nocardia sp. NPDC052566]|uniref:TetR/AcrR family transcriptional regulator n=1 Tax=Nocardia sp. NPDC052566 TaxID=3364330 RepID=UPI0037C6E4B3
MTEPTTEAGAGRVAQRRRTRKAIVDATMTLLERGAEPSVNDIAAAADVSRRTIYLHFPTLDQLMLDATLGLLSAGTDALLEQVGSDDPLVRVTALARAMGADIDTLLPLGRRLIKLTVDAAPAADGPRRGYRRVRWIEWALAPLRDRLSENRFDELVSGVAMVLGWEAFVVLIDVRGLTPTDAVELSTRTAATLVESAMRP